MHLRQIIQSALLAAAIGLSQGATAHDSPALHGGVVRTVGDMHFELVARESGTVIHVADHGKPVPTVGMSGKLTVLKGKETSETPLLPAGENRLEAKGVKLGSGAKAVASIVRNGKTISVRFAVK